MNKYKTVRWVKCTCPRGTFSHNCPVEHHRSMAWEIDTIFGLTTSNNTGTGRRRKPRSLPAKRNYRRRDWKATTGRWARGVGRVFDMLLESARHKISQITAEQTKESGEDIEARFESLDARINRLTSMPVSDLVDAYQHDMPMLARILEMRESMIRARGCAASRKKQQLVEFDQHIYKNLLDMGYDEDTVAAAIYEEQACERIGTMFVIAVYDDNNHDYVKTADGLDREWQTAEAAQAWIDAQTDQSVREYLITGA